MEKEIFTIKTELEKIINKSCESILFTKKYGKRNEFQFNIGKGIINNEIIYENNKYIIFGENFSTEKIEKITEFMKLLN